METQHEEPRSAERTALIAAVVVTVLNAIALLWFVVLPALQDDDSDEALVSGVPAPASTVEDSDARTATDGETQSTQPPATAPVAAGATTTTTIAPTTTPAATTTPAPESQDPDAQVRNASADTTEMPATTAPPTTAAATTVPPPPTTAAPAPTTTAAPDTDSATGEGPSYPTLPDGRPEPIQAIYNGEQIVVAGPVPDEASRERLLALALANSKSPTAEVVDFLTIDPTVPISIGVRVTELQSTRFPTSSAEITASHALELDRVTGIMNALPDITVLILGHSDQRGTEEQNYAISNDRALAVADYLVASGISPLRVTARPIGESELLTLERTQEALALNRRTEFVFYGLLEE